MVRVPIPGSFPRYYSPCRRACWLGEVQVCIVCLKRHTDTRIKERRTGEGLGRPRASSPFGTKQRRSSMVRWSVLRGSATKNSQVITATSCARELLFRGSGQGGAACTKRSSRALVQKSLARAPALAGMTNYWVTRLVLVTIPINRDRPMTMR